MPYLKVKVKEDNTYELLDKRTNKVKTYKTKGNCMREIKKEFPIEIAKKIIQCQDDSDDSDDELDKEIERVRLENLKMEKKIEKKRLLLEEKARLEKLNNDFADLDNKFAKSAKKFAKTENTLAIQANSFADIDLVPSIPPIEMNITRQAIPPKIIMPNQEEIKLNDVPIEEVKEINEESLNGKYDIDKIKVIIHMIRLKQLGYLRSKRDN